MAEELDAGEASEQVDGVIAATYDALKALGEEVATAITPLVRSILVKKYNASGMKVQTGKTLNALKNVEVKVHLTGKKPRVSYTLPAGISDYKEGGSTMPFYEVFTANAYGALKAPGVSKKDKQKIKKKLMKKGKKGDKSFLVGRYQITGNIIKTLDKDDNTKTSTTVVTRPKDFWIMNEAETALVQDAITKFCENRLAKS